jgi:hypothetical protein
MQLDQPEVFVYFLLNRRLLFPTDKRTPSDPTALCNLGVRQFVLGCENGRTGVEERVDGRLIAYSQRAQVLLRDIVQILGDRKSDCLVPYLVQEFLQKS